MSPDLAWRVALLGAVIAADVITFAGLVAQEIRDLRASRSTKKMLPVALERLADESRLARRLSP